MVNRIIAALKRAVSALTALVQFEGSAKHDVCTKVVCIKKARQSRGKAGSPKGKKAVKVAKNSKK